MKKFIQDNKSNPWFWAFIFVTVLFFFAMPIMSLDAGNSGDEDGFQWPYGEKVYNFYATGGKDRACLADTDMGMHGGFFDQFTVLIVKTFHIENYSQARHVMNSLFGWVGLLFAGLLAYRLRGWRAAALTIILMFLSPRYLGHSFNNPKDLIFAAMMMASLYYLFRLIQEYPKPKTSTAVLLSVFTALAIVSRFAGYLVFAYLVFFLIIYHIIINKKKSFSPDATKTIGRYVLFTLGIGIGTFILTIALWPYIMPAPIQTTVDIFHEMSDYFVSIRQLFEGSFQWSDILPWYYTPKYIAITIPIAVLVGLLLFFIFCWRKKEDRFWSFALFFTFFFPIFWLSFSHANIYGGWRHALFAYPPMVVAASLGFDGIMQWIEEKVAARKWDSPSPKGKWIVNLSATVVFLLLLIGPIRHIAANHPYEYIYFNEFIGGMDKAYGNYELDYYYNSTREAAEWVIAHADKNADGSKVKVATWHTASANYFFRKDTADFQVVFARWYEKETVDWDYAIFTITGINAEYLKNPAFPPKNTVKTIDVDGVPIGIILKREDKNDFMAYEAKGRQQYDSAKTYALAALQHDPENLGALQCLGEVYGRMQQPDSSIFYLEKYLKMDSKSEAANYLKAYAFVVKNDYPTALSIISEVAKTNIKYQPTHYLAIQIYLQQQDLISAQKEFQKLIELDLVDEEFIRLWVIYHHLQGVSDNMAYANLYRLLARNAEKRGRDKEAKEYWRMSRSCY